MIYILILWNGGTEHAWANCVGRPAELRPSGPRVRAVGPLPTPFDRAQLFHFNLPWLRQASILKSDLEAMPDLSNEREEAVPVVMPVRAVR
jgi:hypothetical protein